jgi:hypothetical protein
MKRTLLKFSCLVLLLTLFQLVVKAQSQKGYVNAGDVCFNVKDFDCAANNYLLALDYHESSEIRIKLADAYHHSFKFNLALQNYLLLLKDSLTSTQKSKTEFAILDVYRRLKRFEDAALFSDKIQIEKEDSAKFAERLIGLKYASGKWRDSVSIDCIRLGKDINTLNFEFSPTELNDSTLMYSARKFSKTEEPTDDFIAKIVVSKKEKQGTPLSKNINQENVNTANCSVSQDGKLLVFTKCKESDDGELICNIYESEKVKNDWGYPTLISREINRTGFTATQPCIVTNKNEGYILYFSSNRDGGKGGLDIWKSYRSMNKTYSKPINLNAPLNTASNEITPFYDAITNQLFFSSDREMTLGGYDIFSIDTISGLAHLHFYGTPVNSEYNDLYYSAGITPIHNRYLVSNRPSNPNSTTETCCYDIFKIKTIEEEIKTDTLVVAKNGNGSSDTILTEARISSNVNTLKSLLPLKLYFENDQPNPKTRMATTTSSFDDLIFTYLSKQKKYSDAHGNNLLAKNKIDGFFEDSLNQALTKLNLFASKSLELLTGGMSITLKIKGSASPLADSEYNEMLSKRRIVSILNYLKKWNNNALLTFINSKDLVIFEEPTGENLSSLQVSDKLNDQSNSVYSLEAALERRIEIIEFEVN